MSTIFESHWRRRREQKIVLKAGKILPCESPARYANVSFSGSGVKAEEGRGQLFFFSVTDRKVFLIHGFPICFSLSMLVYFFRGTRGVEFGGNECENRQVAIVTWLIGAVRD